MEKPAGSGHPTHRGQRKAPSSPEHTGCCQPFRSEPGCFNKGQSVLGSQKSAGCKQGVSELCLGGQMLTAVHTKPQNFVCIGAGSSDPSADRLDTDLSSSHRVLGRSDFLGEVPPMVLT